MENARTLPKSGNETGPEHDLFKETTKRMGLNPCTMPSANNQKIIKTQMDNLAGCQMTDSVNVSVVNTEQKQDQT